MEGIKKILSGFETALDRVVLQSWKSKDTAVMLEKLVAGAETVGEEILRVGNTYWAQIESGERAFRFTWSIFCGRSCGCSIICRSSVDIY